MLYDSPSVERPKRLIARWPSRSPRPHFTTATASTEAVRIGNAPITTDRMQEAKIANRCHACTLNLPGGGTNQIASATASVISRVIRWRRSEGPAGAGPAGAGPGGVYPPGVNPAGVNPAGVGPPSV